MVRRCFPEMDIGKDCGFESRLDRLFASFVSVGTFRRVTSLSCEQDSGITRGDP
jgi:hypothetical protein